MDIILKMRMDVIIDNKKSFQISMLFPMATNDFCMNNTMYTT